MDKGVFKMKEVVGIVILILSISFFIAVNSYAFYEGNRKDRFERAWKDVLGKK